MKHVPAELQRHLQASAPGGIDLLFRPMFGGIGAYADGRMFCSLSDVGLALKFRPDDRDALLRVKGARPLQYEPSMPPSKSYVVVPDAMLTDRKALGAWIGKSAAFVKSAPARKPKKKKSAKA
ncbi:MAG TPA: TfoX/Sxy family protein [Rhizomicrobium sp.]|jgi:TfoX/Sxy family transcriptional regulator of competence genes